MINNLDNTQHRHEFNKNQYTTLMKTWQLHFCKVFGVKKPLKTISMLKQWQSYNQFEVGWNKSATLL